ncbi:MAG: DUF697 domain-containing protein [Planctomycetaceae bacterium]|nr:DUF697 domain-containing protein [Planctomycetaceae bacterium]
MPRHDNVSPNVPDVMPDYVDLPRSASATAVLEPPPDREDPVPAASDAVTGSETGSAKANAHAKATTTAQASTEAIDEPASHVHSPTGPAPESSPSAEALPDSAAAPSRENRHRDGECVPNVPDVAPDLVSQEETDRLAAGAAASSRTVLPEPPPAAPAWLRWQFLITALAIGVFGVLVFSQAVSALALAATLPEWARYLLLVPLAGCCLIVLGVCVSLAVAWLRLRTMRQINLSTLEELRRRAETRDDGTKHLKEARDSLETYLKQYPLTDAGLPRLRAAGLPDTEVERVAKARDRLIGRSTDSRSWIADFQDNFQSPIDSAAAGRINAWSLKAAGCVIASPLPLLDAVLVLGISMKMLKDLATLYNIRTNRSGTFVLLNRAIVAAFIAGVADDAAEVAGGMAAEELGGFLGESAMDSLGARVAGVVAPKLGEGVINAFFVRRLGKAAVRLLQPVRPK